MKIDKKLSIELVGEEVDNLSLILQEYLINARDAEVACTKLAEAIIEGLD